MIESMLTRTTGKRFGRTLPFCAGMLLVLSLLSAGVGCDDRHPVGSNNNNHACVPPGCTDDDVCGPGLLCVECVCLQQPPGPPDIEVCSLALSLPDPEPFGNCVLDSQGEPIIDFGSLPGPVDASQLVVVANLADGSFPLTVTGVTPTDVGGQGPLYLVELFRREEDPGTGQTVEVPATLPVFLTGGDPILGLPPDRLFVRLWLDTQMHGSLPADDLVIDSDDPVDPQLTIPIVGQVLGAPVR